MQALLSNYLKRSQKILNCHGSNYFWLGVGGSGFLHSKSMSNFVPNFVTVILYSSFKDDPVNCISFLGSILDWKNR